jgi:hypothetical protein
VGCGVVASISVPSRADTSVRGGGSRSAGVPSPTAGMRDVGLPPSAAGLRIGRPGEKKEVATDRLLPPLLPSHWRSPGLATKKPEPDAVNEPGLAALAARPPT